MGKAFVDALNGPRDPNADIEGSMGTGDVLNMYNPGGDYSVGGNDQNLYNTLGQQSNNYQLSNDASIANNIAAQRRAASAMPNDIPYDQMFPSANNNINKGSYSGSIVGSVPIFVPSQLSPFGMIDRRNAAMNKAAADVAAQNADFSKTKAPETKLFAVQGQLDEQFSKGLDQWTANAKKQYGDNWSSALKQDPGFNKWMQSMDTLAKYHTGIADSMAEIDAQMKNGDFVASPELRKIMADTKSGINNLQNPFDPKGHDVGTNLLKLRAVYDLDKATNTAVDQVIKTVTDSYPGISSQGIYDLITKKTTTGVDDSRVAQIADEVWNSKYSDGSGFTKQQVYDAILAKLGPKATTYKTDTATNQFSNAGGADLKYDATAINPEEQEVTYTDVTPLGLGSSVTPGSYSGKVVTSSGQTFGKPINLNVTNNVQAVDPSTGQHIDIPANSKIQIGQTFNVLVNKNGTVLTKDQSDAEIAKGTDPQKEGWHYATYAAGTVQQGTETTGTKTPARYDDKGNLIEAGSSDSESTKNAQTMWIPVEGIKGGLATFDEKGNVTKGARVDIQKQNADKKTQELYNKHSSGAPKYSQQGADKKYSIKGTTYTHDQLIGMGYTDADIAAYETK